MTVIATVVGRAVMVTMNERQAPRRRKVSDRADDDDDRRQNHGGGDEDDDVADDTDDNIKDSYERDRDDGWW